MRSFLKFTKFKPLVIIGYHWLFQVVTYYSFELPFTIVLLKVTSVDQRIYLQTDSEIISSGTKDETNA